MVSMTMTSSIERDSQGRVVCRALTLWQPWASLVVHGLKRFETRSWSTTHRGLLAIHAAARPVSQAEYAQFADLLARCRIEGPEQLPRGVIVGFACVSEIFSVDYIRGNLTDEERRVGDFSPGRYAWMLDGPVWLVEPIPCRGRQGLWTVTLGIAVRDVEPMSYLAGLRYLGVVRTGEETS